MENKSEILEILKELQDQTQNLQKLAERVSQLGSQIKKISGEFEKYEQKIDILNGVSTGSAVGTSTLIDFNNYRAPANNNIQFTKNTNPIPSRRFNVPEHYPCNIIRFPGSIAVSGHNNSRKDHSTHITPILAIPGTLIPQHITDYRPFLQHDGLILLAWDKRDTEMGERYTAYWITSTEIPRFYASKLHTPASFPTARPEHKSYAAEDGVEFYGQKDPMYIVHVAPELMKSNPRHGELRAAHINLLKSQGSKVDFEYKFLLKTDKSRILPLKKPRNESNNHAGA